MIRMTTAQHTIVVIDATSIHLPLLGRATAALSVEEAACVRMVAAGREDLFDAKRVAAMAATVRAASALVLLPHGGGGSIPGVETLAEAASGRLIHVQASGMSPEDVELAQTLGSDFGSPAMRPAMPTSAKAA
jgi:hypothetical protein